MHGNHIEMGIIEAVVDEIHMGVAQILAGVIVGSAKHHGEEGFLLGALLVHVDGIEDLTDAVVVEDLTIERVDGGIDGGLATYIIEKTLGHHCSPEQSGMARLYALIG